MNSPEGSKALTTFTCGKHNVVSIHRTHVECLLCARQADLFYFYFKVQTLFSCSSEGETKVSLEPRDMRYTETESGYQSGDGGLRSQLKALGLVPQRT